MSKAPSILVVKICCLGDVVFTSPLLRALRAGLPEAKIDYLAGSFSMPITQGLPWINQVLEYPFVWPPKNPYQIGRAAIFFSGLRKKYDVLILTHRALGMRALARLSGIPMCIGFSWKGDERFLSHAVPYNPQAHEAVRYLDLLKPLNLEAKGSELEWAVPDEFKLLAARTLVKKGVDSSKPYAVLMPGGGKNPGMRVPFKRWDLSGYLTLARLLASKGWQVVCLGDQDDQSLCKQVAEAAGARGFSLAGETSLAVLSGILWGAKVVAGNDSGPLHLAEAMRRPNLGFYGPTSPQHYGPLDRAHGWTLWAGVSCSPCLNPTEVWSQRGRLCQDNICMHAISAEEGVKKMEELMTAMS